MSLKQLLGFLWLSLKKSIIFIIIGIFVTSAVLFSLRQFTTVSTYRTEIVFKKPTEDALSNLTANKGAVVNEALSKTNKPLELSTDLVEGLSITAVVPEKIETTEDFIPTTFEITLESDKDTGLLDSEYKEILDAIATSYINLFALGDLLGYNFNYNVENKLSSVEYIQVASELYDSASVVLSSIKNGLSTKSVDGTFATLDGKSFNDVVLALESEVNDLSLMQYVIASNKVETDKKGFKSYIEWNIANLDAKIEKYTALVTSAQQNLENYNIIFESKLTETGETVYVLDSEVYLTLSAQLIEYTNVLGEAKHERTIKAEQLAIFEGATENATMKAYVQQELVNAQNTVSSLISDYNELVQKYNQNKYISSDARIMKPAYERRTSPISIVIIIILAFAVALLILTISCIKVFPMFKEQELLKEKAQANLN